MAASILYLIVAVVCLAGAVATMESAARQERGSFGAFVGLGLLGFLAAGAALHQMGALQ